MKIEDLIKQPEGRRLEFKEVLPYKSDLCKTAVAFANDAGGELYIGIQDNPRKVTGIDEDKLLQIEEKINLTTLTKLNLITEEQNRTFPVNAFVLLSSDSIRTQLFPYAKIECARFKGTIPGDFIDQKTIELPLSLQPEEAYRFILRHISKGAEYEGVYRKDRWEYPVIAIREVLRNAVIHRNYALKGKDIKIAVFDDKIEITSPGKLLPTVDFDEMEAGQSDIRNKTLAPVFKKLGIIEQWGNGLRLIYDELKNYPEIDLVWSEPGLAFRVSFIKNNYNPEQEFQAKTDDYGQRPSDTNIKVSDAVGKPSENRRIPSDCSDQEKTILLYLFENQKLISKKVEELIDIKESRARELLRSMVNKNLIERHGKGRSTYYALKKREDDD